MTVLTPSVLRAAFVAAASRGHVEVLPILLPILIEWGGAEPILHRAFEGVVNLWSVSYYQVANKQKICALLLDHGVSIGYASRCLLFSSKGSDDIWPLLLSRLGKHVSSAWSWLAHSMEDMQTLRWGRFSIK